MNRFSKKVKEEKGAVMTIEATFVFPILFFVLLFLIYLGNTYFVKSNVDSVVSRYAISGAAQCADCQLGSLLKNGSVSTDLNAARDPYRYIGRGHGDNVASEIPGKIKKEIKGNSFFTGMQPVDISCKATYKPGVLYRTLKVEATYKIKFPIRFIFSNQGVLLTFSSVEEVPVVDGAEFVLNTNMAIDYVERTGLQEKIDKLVSNIKNFFS